MVDDKDDQELMDEVGDPWRSQVRHGRTQELKTFQELG